MDELSIRIRIADREYPMKVKKEDEERVREAGRLINEKIKSYKEEFGLEDKIDLLAMVAFDYLVDKMASEETAGNLNTAIAEKFNHLNQLVSQSIL
jgi:cell division protein ZapA